MIIYKISHESWFFTKTCKIKVKSDNPEVLDIVKRLSSNHISSSVFSCGNNDGGLMLHCLNWPTAENALDEIDKALSNSNLPDGTIVEIVQINFHKLDISS